MPIKQTKTAEIPTQEIEKKIRVFWLPFDNGYQFNFGGSLKSNKDDIKIGCATN